MSALVAIGSVSAFVAMALWYFQCYFHYALSFLPPADQALTFLVLFDATIGNSLHKCPLHPWTNKSTHPLESLCMKVQDPRSNIKLKSVIVEVESTARVTVCSFLCFIIKEAVNFVFIRAILSTLVVFFACTEVSCKFSSPQYTQSLLNIVLWWSFHSYSVSCALPWKGRVVVVIGGSWLHQEKLHA